MRAMTFLTSLFSRLQSGPTTTFAASVAYYTALSLAPILILFITISSILPFEWQLNFVTQVQALVGVEAARTIEVVLQSAQERPDLVSKSGWFGGLTLLFSAGLIFGELRTALNEIFFHKSNEPDDLSTWQSILHFIKARILHIGLALSFIFLMIVSLLLSSVISATFSHETAYWSFLNVLISFGFYNILFSLLFRYLPDTRIRWKRSFQGGFITSVLFVFGKEVIGYYLGNSALGSSYGAAGSVIVLLAWVYYTALITFVGAHSSAILMEKEVKA